MFDIEHADRLADNRARQNLRKAQAKVLTSAQLKQLCEQAKTAAETSLNERRKVEQELVAAQLIKRGVSGWGRFMAKVFGLPYAQSHEDAMQQAESTVRGYSDYSTNWEATDALTLSQKWLGAVKNVSTIEEFELPRGQYDELLEWASKAGA